MNVQRYLATFYKGTKNPTLNAMKYFMEEFNHPEKQMKIVHIAGTNGKGSCTEMITNILIKSGYKIGKFISPHLVKYNERISIGNKDITDSEMEELINIISSKITKYNEENESKVTLFELETTMALLYFYKNKCDFVVLETGLGGLYDCTNIVNPLVSIITSIGNDHMHILGNSLVEIASQKAGIIKPNSETIFVEHNNEINDVIIKKCKDNNNLLHMIKKKDLLNYSYDESFQKFDYKHYKNILINLKGEKQIYNASICIECMEILKNKGYEISKNAIKDGLKTVVHRGRFEKIHENPVVIYDGGHNKQAIQNFKNSVEMYYKNCKKVYIISILKTKDYKAVLNELLKDEEGVFIFTSGNDENLYVSKNELLLTAKSFTENKFLYDIELENAIDLAINQYKDYVIFIVGSFYIYSDVINKLGK